MARGGVRVGAGRPKRQGTDKAQKTETPKSVDGTKKSPLDFMLGIMNDPTADLKIRMQMAVAAAPYVHGKIAENGKGKKEQAQEAAQDVVAGGKFAPRQTPKLVVNNERR